jgi:hypothetical protein
MDRICVEVVRRDVDEEKVDVRLDLLPQANVKSSGTNMISHLLSHQHRWEPQASIQQGARHQGTKA